jgi:hypothetical protein
MWGAVNPHCLGLSWATLLPGEINTETWPSRLEESQI